MLGLLLGEKQHVLYQVRRPLVYRTVLGELQFGAYDPDSQRHLDQCLSVFAELGISLDRELRTENGTGTVHEALRSSLLNFSIQQEFEWSAVAFARYLPPIRQWENRWAEAFSFEDVATALLNRELGKGACFGTHALYAMSVLVQIDDQYDIISSALRRSIVDRLVEARRLLEKNQLRDGSWTPTWWDESLTHEDIHHLPEAHLLMAHTTGHHLEWVMLAPRDAIPPEACLRNALLWSYQVLRNAEPKDVHGSICPYSHCLKCLYNMCLPSELINGFVPSENS